ncbi:Nephrin [Amphibalanus amphitrite]|uniref:Nephrin n=1 Tax=Amphibalanus amphitrite TaxID=1232801 RepID=A0A6A4W5C3_AMPAM|nr:Nephrin [Amphibalanus amphitrite]
MLGDPGSGVHDLEVTNVTLEDDGRFQCQVSPNRGQDAIRADAILTVSRGTAGSPGPLQRNGLDIRPADDGAGISCVAQHPAIAPEDRQKLNATVRLSVLHPPGAPEISGYTEGEVVSIGQQKTLTCISRGGNPPAQLVWLKNGRPIGSKYRQEDGRAVAVLVVDAEVFNMNATFRCQASSKAQQQVTETYIIVNVLFGPDEVTVSGTQEAKGGDTVHMSCITSSSNLPANISWVINGETLNNTSQETSVAGDGGWISSSNISTVVPIGMRQDMTVACYGLNPRSGAPKSDYPPEPPTILGYESGSHLRAGERVSLSCVSQGGNPPATLTWYRGDTELASSTEVRDSVARSVVTFQVDHADNGRVYTCHSTNSKLGGVQSASVELSVYCKLMKSQRLNVAVSWAFHKKILNEVGIQ